MRYDVELTKEYPERPGVHFSVRTFWFDEVNDERAIQGAERMNIFPSVDDADHARLWNCDHTKSLWQVTRNA